MIDYLTIEDLVEVARRVVDGEVLVRDAGLLASAVARPQSSVFGQDAYPGVWEKAAARATGRGRSRAVRDRGHHR